MGLFDFVKNAGRKIFGKDDDEPQAGPDPQALARQRAAANQRKADSLVAEVNRLGITIDGLAVTVDGDLARVSGTASSQAEREKVVLVVGNTLGIARVDDQMVVSEPEPEAVFYTVERGDTLSKIAKEQYGNAMKYPVIFEANKPMLTDPDKIYPGQVLRIPPLEG
jgi:nucleoid-associated protein YgaU